ncbi:MAG: DUF6680 family protein [Culicoidibacterales bacterium]
MEALDIINILIIIISPVIAVCVGQQLQINSKKRDDKMQIFKSLMTARIYGWTTESVHNLNVIEIVFAEDKEVCRAWKILFDKYRTENPTETELQKIQILQNKLIEQMAIALGYKEKITWETIQNPYIPKGMAEQIRKNTEMNDNQARALAVILENSTR